MGMTIQKTKSIQTMNTAGPPIVFENMPQMMMSTTTKLRHGPMKIVRDYVLGRAVNSEFIHGQRRY